MTIRLVFKNDVSAYDLDCAILPDKHGHNISVSNNSPKILRHDITVGKSGDRTWVEVDRIEESEMSQATMDSIINIVPADHLRTENV